MTESITICCAENVIEVDKQNASAFGKDNNDYIVTRFICQKCKKIWTRGDSFTTWDTDGEA